MPFTLTPVPPERFADRQNEIERFVRLVDETVTGLPQPIAILGGWATGKTSLLYKFREVAKESDRRIIASRITLDPSTKDLYQFVNIILHQLRADGASITFSKRLKEFFTSFKITVPTPIGEAGLEAVHRAQALPASFYFKGSLKNIWMNVAEHGIPAILIMIDEAAVLTKIEGSLEMLRNVFEDLFMDGCRYMPIVAGRPDLLRSFGEIHSPIARFFHNQMSLRPFTLDEAEELIEKALQGTSVKFTQSLVEKVWAVSQGHPHFIQRICRVIYNNRPADVVDATVLEDFQVRQRIFDEDINPFLEERFQRASSLEKRLLLSLADATESASLKEISAKAKIEKRIASQCLSRLMEKDLVERIERGRYQLFHPLFKDFLRQRPGKNSD